MSPRLSNLILCLAMYSLSILFLVMASRLRYPSNVWPYLICIAILAFTTVIFITQVLLTGPKKVKERVEKPGAKLPLGRLGLMATGSLIYAALMDYVGFYTVSFIFLIALFNLTQLEHRSWTLFAKTVGLSLVILGAIYIVFNILLSVPTPTGLLI